MLEKIKVQNPDYCKLFRNHGDKCYLTVVCVWNNLNQNPNIRSHIYLTVMYSIEMLIARKRWMVANSLYKVPTIFLLLKEK